MDMRLPSDSVWPRLDPIKEVHLIVGGLHKSQIFDTWNKKKQAHNLSSYGIVFVESQANKHALFHNRCFYVKSTEAQDVRDLNRYLLYYIKFVYD